MRIAFAIEPPASIANPNRGCNRGGSCHPASAAGNADGAGGAAAARDLGRRGENYANLSYAEILRIFILKGTTQCDLHVIVRVEQCHARRTVSPRMTLF
jgi:hypothetical protein